MTGQSSKIRTKWKGATKVKIIPATIRYVFRSMRDDLKRLFASIHPPGLLRLLVCVLALTLIQLEPMFGQQRIDFAHDALVLIASLNSTVLR